MTSSDLEDLLRQAQEAHRSGHLGEGERQYLRLIEVVPANADLRHLLGVIVAKLAGLRQRIRERSRLLFEDAEPLHAFAEFLRAQANPPRVE